MAKRLVGLFLLFNLVLTLGWAWPARAAQTAAEVEAQRAQLQAELEQEERAIAEQTKLLQAKQKETATVQGDIDILKNQIKQAQTNIKAKQVAIARLTDDIIARQGKIAVLGDRIKEEQSSLGELLRKTRDVDTSSLPEILLDNNSLSGFFNDVDDFNSVQHSIHDSMALIRDTQAATRAEQAALEDKKSKELDAQQTIELERQRIAAREKDKQTLLAINKSQEASYREVLVERQRKAASIRAALFALRDTTAIPFGDALGFAQEASRQTGVRPALILAVLTQESNLGQNVGSCVVTNLSTGEAKSLRSGTIFPNGIHPTRDLPILRALLPTLGRDPLNTPVSCPQSVGYGGAMGPAQFIPSTWQLMGASIARLTGSAAPDPWNPQDAIMAMALLLRDNGATGGTSTNERTAACKYFSGTTCYNSQGRPNVGLTYGNQVLAKAADIQVNMIEPLQNN